MPVYEPQEDSELLAKFVKQYATGSVLDMGSGSGIQAQTAAKNDKVTSVLAVDIDEDAIIHLRTLQDKKLSVRKSDLFSSLDDETFDTIIFNPPYLPDEDSDNHPALYGGKEGWELIARFLKQATTHLNKDGIILLLFSSLSNKERVLGVMKSEYVAQELALEAHFFEQLYVYKLGVKHG